jgi:hypothetical protein
VRLVGLTPRPEPTPTHTIRTGCSRELEESTYPLEESICAVEERTYPLEESTCE